MKNQRELISNFFYIFSIAFVLKSFIEIVIQERLGPWTFFSPLIFGTVVGFVSSIGLKLFFPLLYKKFKSTKKEGSSKN
jgi:hypothetical protein